MLLALGATFQKKTLDLSYYGKKLLDERSYVDIGHTVYNLANTVPGGVLVFFGSKSDMKNCCNLWKSDPTLSQAKWFVEGSQPASQLQNEFKAQVEL